MSLSPADADGLRPLVREVLVEALAAAKAPAGSETTVAIGDDAELGAFVARLLELFEQPGPREEIRSGRMRFRLASGDREPPREGGEPLRVESGAVTEKIVARAASEGRRLILGRRAVLTPLALDKARRLGVDVERTG